MPFRPLILLLLVVLTAGPAARAQSAEKNPPPYGSGVGLKIELTNSGFGLGGYGRYAVSPSLSMAVEISLSTGKDENEGAFSDAFGRRIIRGKANYFLMLPFRVGVQKRLFRHQIASNFRPFVQLSAGPTTGYVYPYFEDANGNGRYDIGGSEERYGAFSGLLKGHFQMGAGVLLALGAHFGWSRKTTRAVRLGYRLDYFPTGVQLLEPARGGPQHFFGTPTLTVSFGRIF